MWWYANMKVIPVKLPFDYIWTSAQPETKGIQETPFILACSNIDYLRCGNIKFNYQLLRLRYQKYGTHQRSATLEWAIRKHLNRSFLHFN